MSGMTFFPENVHREHIDHLLEHRRVTFSGIGNLNAKAFFVHELLTHSDPHLLKKKKDGFNTVFWVLEDPAEAEHVMQSFEFWGSHRILNLISKPGVLLSPFEKAMRLYALLRDERKVVLIDEEMLLSHVPAREDIEKATLKLKIGDDLDGHQIINQLLTMGYEFSADEFLIPGSYNKQGGMMNIFVPTMHSPVKLEMDGDVISGIFEYDQENQQLARKYEELEVVPLTFPKEKARLIDYLDQQSVLLDDEVGLHVENEEDIKELFEKDDAPALLSITAFPEEEDKHYYYLYYLSILKFQDVFDFLNDLREKQKAGWKVMIFTKHFQELKGVLTEEKVKFSSSDGLDSSRFLHVEDASRYKYLPESFQNPDLKIALITDREIFDFRQIRQKVSKVQRKVNLEFLHSLNEGDFVVHVDHGIGRFIGIEQQEIDEMMREYLKIEYADNDKLYVPIDQAEKVNKYVGVGSTEPKLTRLGSSEWTSVTKKVRKETESIARELLMLYSKREMAKGTKYMVDDEVMEQFEATFPYDETPGQRRAIIDVKKDMETEKPMDRLVCGDVGFGKTEVALRAAFKAVRSGKQVAVITPITILSDQHYKEFTKRMGPFKVRIEMLSRFRTAAEQRQILKDLAAGKLDIVIGTHRLLQPDVAFKDLGMVIIDEEQRFGVKQKEKLKELRASVDILTLTATPIPRTLNMSMNKLRDITIITTPPPGRLPIITEVRRFSENLIKQAVDREITRSGQVYFLHNRVQTIESMADKLRTMFPHLKIVVAHGKLSPHDLEQRIMAFKEAKYDILVSSTIIENGIDLPNANTMIVNNADQFGLSQLYQLRGRIGRGRTQAYAYMMYHSQKLKSDAKRRLRAIVEANELGAGFQIAMHDLEIRGAGDILGANQSGSINVVGASHFVRLLQQTVAELKSGKQVTQDLEDLEKIIIDLPISAYIPDKYIAESREKINAYQRMSSATNFDELKEMQQEFEGDFGEFPEEVRNLFKVLELKIYARNADIVALRTTSSGPQQRELILTMGKGMKPEQIVGLLDHNGKWIISGTTLKIDMKELGIAWVEGLRESLEILGQKGERGKKKETSEDGKESKGKKKEKKKAE